MSSSHRRAGASALALFALVAASFGACGGDATGPGHLYGDPALLQLLAGGSRTDTVHAVLPEAVLVEVRDAAGVPIPGIEIRFQPIALNLGKFSAAGFQGLAVVERTDATGRAGVRVQLDTIPGAARLRISVSGSQLADTIAYTILPGAPSTLVVAPRDTALYRDATYQLRVSATDRFNNALAPSFEYTAIDGVATVSPDGEVTGVQWGRSRFHIGVGSLLDSVAVSVVPEGTIAAHTNPDIHAGDRSMVVVDLDGSGYRTLSTTYPDNFQSLEPFWAPDGQEIFYQEGVHDPRLFAIDLEGSVRTLIPSSPLGREATPHASRDGSWVFFEGDRTIWRVRPDGSSPERIGPVVDPNTELGRPSPSPTGDRLVFVSSGYPFISRMRILDTDSGVVDELDIIGASPRWSPTADWVAYILGDSGPIKVMRPDGSDQRQVSQGLARYWGGLDWSPDGEWVVVRNIDTQRVHIIHVSTGLSLPLPYTERLLHPTWRPDIPGG